MLRPRIHFEKVPLSEVLKKTEEAPLTASKPPKKRRIQNRRIEIGVGENARSENATPDAR